MKFTYLKLITLLIMSICFPAHSYWDRGRLFPDKDTTVSKNSSTSNTKEIDTSSLRGYRELGFVGGLQIYGRSDSKTIGIPGGLYLAFHVSDHGFIQPVASFQLGISGVNNASYLQAGLKYGLMSSPLGNYNHIFWTYWAFGCAYQHSWGTTTDGFGGDFLYSRHGFVVPIEFGIKKELSKRKSILTIAFSVAVGNDDNNTQWGYGITVAYTWLMNILKNKDI
jgi:hypothetical protein